PGRQDIFRADARKLPLEDDKADFVFIDPPYSTHIQYSDSPQDIGRLDAAGADAGEAYYQAMDCVIAEAHRVLKNRRYMGLYVSDSWRKRKGGDPGSGGGTFMPIGFELFPPALSGAAAPLLRPASLAAVGLGAQLRRGLQRRGPHPRRVLALGRAHRPHQRLHQHVVVDDDPPPLPSPAPRECDPPVAA